MFRKNNHFINSGRFLLQLRFNHMRRDDLYKRCYEILGVKENSDQNSVRQAYLTMVKKVHPDSGHEEANAETFQEVDEAFKLLQEKYAKGRRGIEDDPNDEVPVFDIKHTAPQHRQYLTYGGFGIGTPFQREKQYQHIRAWKAQENVMEHRLQQAQSTDNALMKKGGNHFKKHAIKTKYGFDRVVEDLIQEAMSKGNFNNLSGSGKPLSDTSTQNPYVDFTTHKINKILMDNGFVPEWIMQQKEIREEIKDLKESLQEERQKIGKLPLDSHDQRFWDKKMENFRKLATAINKKIDNFNLIVPVLDKQLHHFQLQQLADEILKSEPFETSNRRHNQEKEGIEIHNQPSDYKTNLFTLIGSMFQYKS